MSANIIKKCPNQGSGIKCPCKAFKILEGQICVNRFVGFYRDPTDKKLDAFEIRFGFQQGSKAKELSAYHDMAMTRKELKEIGATKMIDAFEKKFRKHLGGCFRVSEDRRTVQSVRNVFLEASENAANDSSEESSDDSEEEPLEKRKVPQVPVDEAAKEDLPNQDDHPSNVESLDVSDPPIRKGEETQAKENPDLDDPQTRTRMTEWMAEVMTEKNELFSVGTEPESESSEWKDQGDVPKHSSTRDEGLAEASQFFEENDNESTSQQFLGADNERTIAEQEPRPLGGPIAQPKKPEGKTEFFQESRETILGTPPYCPNDDDVNLDRSPLSPHLPDPIEIFDEQDQEPETPAKRKSDEAFGEDGTDQKAEIPSDEILTEATEPVAHVTLDENEEEGKKVEDHKTETEKTESRPKRPRNARSVNTRASEYSLRSKAGIAANRPKVRATGEKRAATSSSQRRAKGSK